MNTPTFKDKFGADWTIEIVVSDVERVRKRVINKDGKPVDLLDMTEKGDFSAILADSRIFPTVVFWLLYDEIMTRFSEEQYDADHAAEYAAYPEDKRLNTIQKAARWFGDQLGGDEVAAMAKAFEVALLNFMSPQLREKLKRVIAKQEELTEAILELTARETESQITTGLTALSESLPPSSESTSADTPSAS